VIDWITGNARTVDERTVATAGADPAVVGGRYELGALLGTGASAVVRRGLDRVSGRTFAVKLFHAGASAHDRRRQQREMSALATLHHPGLVALYDGGVEDGRPFIVTDLVEGPTLAERLDAGPLDPEELLGVGARLADALAHVHHAGIVHRDLKPANVLLGADGPRLADFGIARALDGTAVTGTGYVVGTAAYLAPEQVRGEWVGPQADVYALGLVLLEALTGRREYPGALVESATARLHRPPGIPTGLPFALDTALRAMTALDPADRPTAADVATMLAGPSRRGRRRAGAHRRARPLSPRIAGAATILAVAAVVTGVALPPVEHAVPSVSPHDLVGPETRTVAAVPPPAAPWEPASAGVLLHRVAATLGESAEAARLQAEAVEKALRIQPSAAPLVGASRHVHPRESARSSG
jgi:eukaryotic-like serine/threonine-protein kinase